MCAADDAMKKWQQEHSQIMRQSMSALLAPI
jgi:hypothetical protein